MTGGPEPISADAREALERQLAELRQERDGVADTLRGGDEVGDMADGADELARATELDRLDARIDKINGRLREAAAAAPPPADTVGVGSTVTIRFADATQATVHIGELADELDPDLVTADSPLGRSLLGHRAGDTVDYVAPAGRTTAVVVSLGDADDKS